MASTVAYITHVQQDKRTSVYQCAYLVRAFEDIDLFGALALTKPSDLDRRARYQGLGRGLLQAVRDESSDVAVHVDGGTCEFR